MSGEERLDQSSQGRFSAIGDHLEGIGEQLPFRLEPHDLFGIEDLVERHLLWQFAHTRLEQIDLPLLLQEERIQLVLGKCSPVDAGCLPGLVATLVSGAGVPGEVPGVAVFARVDLQRHALLLPQDVRSSLRVPATSIGLFLLTVPALAEGTFLARRYPVLGREMPLATYTAGIGHEIAAIGVFRVSSAVLGFFQRVILCQGLSGDLADAGCALSAHEVAANVVLL